MRPHRSVNLVSARTSPQGVTEDEEATSPIQLPNEARRSRRAGAEDPSFETRPVQYQVSQHLRPGPRLCFQNRQKSQPRLTPPYRPGQGSAPSLSHSLTQGPAHLTQKQQHQSSGSFLLAEVRDLIDKDNPTAHDHQSLPIRNPDRTPSVVRRSSLVRPTGCVDP